MMVKASLLSSAVLLSDTRQCEIQDLGFGPHYAEKLVCHFAEWVVLREASILHGVPLLEHVKHSREQSGADCVPLSTSSSSMSQKEFSLGARENSMCTHPRKVAR